MPDINHLLKVIKTHIVEIILLSSALGITILAISPYFSDTEATLDEPTTIEISPQIDTPAPSNEILTVDIAGAILAPDIYEVTEGARLADIIKLAGGMAPDADNGYIARNFNMSRFVTDQEKIYIPSKKDISSGIFKETPKILQYLTDGQTEATPQPEKDRVANNTLTISINAASKEELDMLPGVGPTTAQKIIDSRPYESLDELVSKKTMKQSVFDDIKTSISL